MRVEAVREGVGARDLIRSLLPFLKDGETSGFSASDCQRDRQFADIGAGDYAEGGLGMEGAAGCLGAAGCAGAFGWTGAFGWLGTSGTVGV